jgi:hypothetical protein
MPRPVPGAIFWRYSTYQKFGVSSSCSEKPHVKNGEKCGNWKLMIIKRFDIKTFLNLCKTSSKLCGKLGVL